MLHAFSCLYAEDFTKQEYKTFIEISSRGNLTCVILLGYYFQTWQYNFSKRTVKQKENKSISVGTEVFRLIGGKAAE